MPYGRSAIEKPPPHPQWDSHRSGQRRWKTTLPATRDGAWCCYEKEKRSLAAQLHAKL